MGMEVTLPLLMAVMGVLDMGDLPRAKKIDRLGCPVYNHLEIRVHCQTIPRTGIIISESTEVYQ